MGDALRKVVPGERLEIAASTWNAMLDAVRYANAQRVFDTEPVPTHRDLTVIKVRNDTGADVPRFGVLGLNDPLILPSDNESEFQRVVACSGVLPATGAHEGKFAIALEPIAPDKIGNAAISGVVPVKLLVDPGDLKPFADIQSGSTSALANADIGSARVLWIESGASSERWCRVRLGDGANGEGIALTVKDVAGAIIIDNVTTLEVDGINCVSSPIINIARLHAASATNAGIVSTVAQTFAGDKTVLSNVIAHQDSPSLSARLQARFTIAGFDTLGGISATSAAATSIFLGFDPDNTAITLFMESLAAPPRYAVRWGASPTTYYGANAYDDGVTDNRTRPTTRLIIHGGIVVGWTNSTTLHVPPGGIEFVDSDWDPLGIAVLGTPGATGDDPPTATWKTWPPNTGPGGSGGVTIGTVPGGFKVWPSNVDETTNPPCWQSTCSGYSLYHGGQVVATIGKDGSGNGQLFTTTPGGNAIHSLTADGWNFESGGNNVHDFTTSGWNFHDGTGNQVHELTTGGWNFYDGAGNIITSITKGGPGGAGGVFTIYGTGGVGGSGGKITIIGGGPVIALAGPGGIPVLKIKPNGVFKQGGDSKDISPNEDAAIIAGAGDGSAVIETAKFEDAYIPYPFQILDWTVLCNPTGNIEWELLYSTFGGYDTLASLVGATKPKIMAAVKAQGTPTVADGWKLWFPRGTCLRFKTKDPDTCTKSTITLHIRKGNPVLIDNKAVFWAKGAGIFGLADNDPLASWPDDTFVTGPALQAIAANKPTYQAAELNGRAVVRFDGVNDFMSAANLTLGAFTIFIVRKKTTASGNLVLVEQGPDANTNSGCGIACGIGIGPASNSWSILVNKGGVKSSKNAIIAGAAGWFVLRWRFDGTHAGHKLYLNGADAGLFDGANTDNPGTAEVTDTLYIGARAGSSLLYDGDIEQIIIFNEALTDADCADIESTINTVDGF